MSTCPTGADYRAELQNAGLSEKCIDGLMNVDAIEAVCSMFMEIKKFMKSQSEKDQKKYARYLENQKKKEEAYSID